MKIKQVMDEETMRRADFALYMTTTEHHNKIKEGTEDALQTDEEDDGVGSNRRKGVVYKSEIDNLW